MRFEELSAEQREKLGAYRYDRFIEKHEGPFDWSSTMKYRDLEFMEVDGYDVLFPVDRDHHPNMSIYRVIPSQDEQVLTIFLRDETYYSGTFAGIVAVCERLAGEAWYRAIVYHESYLATKDDFSPLP